MKLQKVSKALIAKIPRNNLLHSPSSLSFYRRSYSPTINMNKGKGEIFQQL